MADNKYFHEPDGLEDMQSWDVDALIASAKQDLGDSAETPPSFADETLQFCPVYGNLPQEPTPRASDGARPPEFGADAVPSAEQFEPDFGSAFQDYGEYYTDAYGDGADTEPPDEYEEDEMPHKRKRIPLGFRILLYLAAVGIASWLLGSFAWSCAKDVLAFDRASGSVMLTVEEDDSISDIAEKLHDEGLIEYEWLFRLYCKVTHASEKIKAGVYELDYIYDYNALVKGLSPGVGIRATVDVMIPEGYECRQIFALLEETGVCTAEKLAEAAANYEFDYWFLEGIPYGETNRLEGFLFPDTYTFYVSDSPENALKKLLDNFEKKFTEDMQAQLSALNEQLAQTLSRRGYDEEYIQSQLLDVYDLVTVASMVEKETAGRSESATIASVIYNRYTNPASYPYLNIDATIQYALGERKEQLTLEDTQIDSPYNTYINTGLPCGPIACPGLSSLQAALSPADTSYYFYALDTDGTHHFSETYEAHQRFLEALENAD